MRCDRHNITQYDSKLRLDNDNTQWFDSNPELARCFLHSPSPSVLDLCIVSVQTYKLKHFTPLQHYPNMSFLHRRRDGGEERNGVIGAVFVVRYPFSCQPVLKLKHPLNLILSSTTNRLLREKTLLRLTSDLRRRYPSGNDNNVYYYIPSFAFGQALPQTVSDHLVFN